MAPHVKGQGIQVTGIPELTRALKRLDPEKAKQLRTAFKAIAVEVIRRANVMGAPRKALKPSVTMKGAGISRPKGGPESFSDPLGYYPWLDFGGGRKLGRGVTSNDGVGASFRRRKVEGGRYLYPAIGASHDYIGDSVRDAITSLARSEGFRVTK